MQEERGSWQTHWGPTFRLWAFALLKIRLVLFLRPRVCRVSEHCLALRIRLNRRTRNHYGSMYFGALVIGAELIPGILSIVLAEKLGKRVSLLTTCIKAEFTKQATGDVIFTCSEGVVIEQHILASAAQNRPKVADIRVFAHRDSAQGGEAIAMFWFSVRIRAK